MKIWIPFYLVLMIMGACKSYEAAIHQLPQPEDTHDKPISYQEKKRYQAMDVFADNQYDGARLNDFRGVTDSLFVAVISPENTPINASAYYSFRIWSFVNKQVVVELSYSEHEHRYWPKISYDRRHWARMDSSRVEVSEDGKFARLRVDIGPDTLYISGQEIMNSTDIEQWSRGLSTHGNVHYFECGKSKRGRTMMGLDIYAGDPKGKDAIVVLARQHPPEVTGQMAANAFVEELLEEGRLQEDFLKKHRILVFPMMNPDGVDLGHWRHNTGGIDLNRDWSHYRQPEVKVVADYIVRTTRKDKNNVLIGLDFHSTQQDLYYTLTDNRPSKIYDFKDYWMEGIDDALEDYTPDDRPYDLNQPISKAWFYLQFGAESVTYEMGDETPRDFVRKKARVAAREMMKLLILRK